MSGDANKVVTASYDRTVKVNSNILLILDFSLPTLKNFVVEGCDLSASHLASSFI